MHHVAEWPNHASLQGTHTDKIADLAKVKQQPLRRHNDYFRFHTEQPVEIAKAYDASLAFCLRRQKRSWSPLRRVWVSGRSQHSGISIAC